MFHDWEALAYLQLLSFEIVLTKKKTPKIICPVFQTFVFAVFVLQCVRAQPAEWLLADSATELLRQSSLELILVA